MKQFKWPRPPLILGVVLGDTIERYLFISIERYGLSWMLRPLVVVLFALAIIGLVRPFLQDIRSQGGVGKLLTSFQRADVPSLAAVHDVHDRADRQRRSSRRCIGTSAPRSCRWSSAPSR